MAETMRPFDCGTQYGDWTDSNCRTCTKAADPDNMPPVCPCDIEQALLDAFMGDGLIQVGIADRMGRGEGRYVWPCMEHNPPFKNVRPDGTVNRSIKRPDAAALQPECEQLKREVDNLARI